MLPNSLPQLEIFEKEKQASVSEYDFETYWKIIIQVQRDYINKAKLHRIALFEKAKQVRTKR